jgi:hypothetical protein
VWILWVHPHRPTYYTNTYSDRLNSHTHTQHTHIHKHLYLLHTFFILPHPTIRVADLAAPHKGSKEEIALTSPGYTKFHSLPYPPPKKEQ